MAEPSYADLLGLASQLARIAGNMKGPIQLTGSEEPDNILGAPGASAYNLDTRKWYGPKDPVTGWPEGIPLTQGPSGTITDVTVTAGAAGSEASIVLGGTPQARTMAFTIPRGDAGVNATITGVSVTTGAAGSSASVTAGGTATERTFAFTIPRGDKGDKGDTGDTPAFSIGGVTTVASDQPADAQITGTAEAPVLTLALPRGADAEITSVTVATGVAGTEASIVLGGTPGARTFALTLPRGDKGDTGDDAVITGVSVTTGIAGSEASVVMGGTPGARTFAFEIPRGDTPNISVAIEMVAHGEPAVVTRSGTDGAPLLTFSLPSPLDGDDGREVEFNVSATHIQTRYVGDSTWADLIALAALKGAKGDRGEAFSVDATGDGLAARDAYDTEAEGFSYVDTATGLIYFRQGVSGWSDGIPFGLAQSDILDALAGLDAAPGVLVQTGAATFSKLAIGASSDTNILDRQSADGRYRQSSAAVPLAEVTGLAAALGDKADAAAVVAALGGKQAASDTLTALAALTTTTFGRALLEKTDAAALKSALDIAMADVSGLTDALAAKASQAALDTLGAAVGAIAVPAKATGAELRATTDDAKFLTPKAVADAAVLAPLTDATTIAVDFATGTNFIVTLGGNRALGAPSNAKPGLSGTILIKQDATGSRTLTYASAWKPFGSAPSLSTVANAVDLLTWIVEEPGKVRFTLAKGGAA